MRLLSDRKEILAACRLLFEPGQVVELRGLECQTREWRRRHTVAGYFDDYEKLASAAAGLDARGVYVTLNPLQPALLARAANHVVDVGSHDPLTSDTDVVRRRWLPVDCDPVRPSGVSASDEEHNLALERADQIRAHLAGEGWPAPLFADSGNGGHLLYRVDLPPDDAAGAGPGAGGLLARTLKALALRFDDRRVTVDQKVANPGRIWKLYGTVAAKGDHVPGRPHRLSRLLDAPDELAAVDPARLQALASWAESADNPHTPSTVGLAFSQPARGFDLAAWVAQHELEVRGPLPWDNGGRKWVFPVCPWDPSHRSGEAFIVQKANGAIGAGCHHNSCREHKWRDLRAKVEGAAPHAAPDSILSGGRSQSARPESKDAPLSGPRAAPGSILSGGRAQFARPESKDAGPLQEAGPYLIDGGRMWKRSFMRRSSGELVEAERKVIADFAVRIVEESHGEDGQVWFTVTGETVEGTPMHCTLPVEDFTAEKVLLAALTRAAGARCGVHAGMTAYLRPAIQALSGEGLLVTRCYSRTGWVETDAGLRFLAPGRDVSFGEEAGVEVRLKKLPYRVPHVETSEVSVTKTSEVSRHQTPEVASLRDGTSEASPPPELSPRLRRALDGFRALLLSLTPERTTAPASLVFQAPLARVAGWTNDRYAIFIAGRTGSLKTSFCQALMSVYGAGFAEDQYLLKLGEGATRNALMSYAEQAHDMPLLVDNYKPNTGDGARGLVNLLHNLIEGGGRERLNKNSELMEARPVGCWPLLTGEDAPRGDAASLARLLVVPVRWPCAAGEPGGHNAQLAAAQAVVADFPLLGGLWLDWLESAEGQAAARAAGAAFEERRASWANRLIGAPADMGSGAVLRDRPGSAGDAPASVADRPGPHPNRHTANALRLATNLATNELTWTVLARHPVLGPVAAEFAEAHVAGLALLAGEMATQTAENVEAVRFLDVLQQLLAAGACRLVERGEERDGEGKWKDGVIGWHAPDGGAYVMPDLARRAVEGVLGSDGLNRISQETLNGQLDEMGYIGEHEKGRRTRHLYVGNQRTVRVLHLAAGALASDDAAT